MLLNTYLDVISHIDIEIFATYILVSSAIKVYDGSTLCQISFSRT